MRHLRLLHTSDVHLGGGFRTPDEGSHLDGCLCPVVAIERAVESHQIDAVLVVGDLFDHQRVSPEFVSQVMSRLGNLGVPCAVINGNHDVHDERSVYPPSVSDTGVLFFDDHGGSIATLFDESLHLWAKAMPMHDRNFRPLQGAPPRPREDAWWVVLGHGHYEPEADDLFGRSSPLSPADIEATAADYLALGHWHIRTDVSTENVTAWYSGAPCGVVTSGSMNLINLHPLDGVTVDTVPVELPIEGCAPVDAVTAH